MSYEIIYNKQFIKLPKSNKVIPFILCGSNNCYETSRYNKREKRARDWTVITYYNEHGFIYSDPEILLQNIKSERDHKVAKVTSPEYWDKDSNYTAEDVDSSYGYFTSISLSGYHTTKTTFQNYLSLFKSGIKNALTLEQLKELGLTIKFKDYTWQPPDDYERPNFEVITSEDHFYSELEKVNEFKKKSYINRSGEKENCWAYLTFNAHYETVLDILKRYRKKNKIKKSKSAVALNKYFVLENDMGYLIRYVKYGYKYAAIPNGHVVKIFESQIKAEKYLGKIIENKKYQSKSWKITTVNKPLIIYR